MTNRRIVQRYAEALTDRDVDAQMACLHEDYVLTYPQSGEVIRGVADRRAIVENYPDTFGQALETSVESVRGGDEDWRQARSPVGWGIMHVGGANDEFSIAGTVRYPNGETWHAVALITVRDGKIWRETDYFAASFDPPDWRKPYVAPPATRR